MVTKKRILFIANEMSPYIELTEFSEIVNKLAIKANEGGYEVRCIMPRFGTINERRHRLHEVVRLSGINITIENDDYPLQIKVASLPNARLQVYFLDNEDMFKRKFVFQDDNENWFDDNGMRSVFFCKGALETVKKFGWPPDIIHCSGWMTSLIPMYLKTTYKNEPLFKETKSVFGIYTEGFSHTFGDDLLNKVKMVDIDDTILAPLRSKDFSGFIKMGMEYADQVVQGSEVSAELNQLIQDFSRNKKFEISFEEEQQAHEELYGMYTSLAG